MEMIAKDKPELRDDIDSVLQKADMGNWFTIDEIDGDTYIISEYRHWEETYCYLYGSGTFNYELEIERIIS